LKRISSIPIQIWLSKNDNIQTNQYIGMSQDLNPKPSTCSSLVIFIYWAWEMRGSLFLVLRLESQSGKCTKFHTVAETKNRDHPTRSLYYCLFVPHAGAQPWGWGICGICPLRNFQKII